MGEPRQALGARHPDRRRRRLVAITPAAGFVEPDGRARDRLRAGARLLLGGDVLKTKLGYDDSLDVFGVHGVGGIVGAMLTGVFATKLINDVNKGQPAA